MNKTLIYLGLFFLLLESSSAVTITKSFSSELVVLANISIQEMKALNFPTDQTGQTKSVVVGPGSSAAALFNVTGAPLKSFVASVLQSSIIIKNGSNTSSRTMIVNNFTIAGPNSFDSNGIALGVGVGATVNIKSNNISGQYVGSATLRIVYL
jgi:hypothetical protein